ncbi:MAG: hypothetical protein AAF456_07075 [Planctomycetota bacterium]
MPASIFKALNSMLVLLLLSMQLSAQETEQDLTTISTETVLFDMGDVTLTAEPGQYVLCPSRQFYDAAVSKGIDQTTFIYYAAVLVENGQTSSTVRNLAGREFSLPNQMIIPIPKGQTASTGDVVLTWWQTGSGMQRAIVVGGTETEPVVRYLDISLDNPSGAGLREDTLKPDSFVRLTDQWQPGSTVAVTTEQSTIHGQLLAVSESKVLVREFAGKLNMYDRENAMPLPVVPELGEGDAAQAALWGSFKPVTVTRVDSEIGRVYANFTLGREEQEKVIAFGDIYIER